MPNYRTSTSPDMIDEFFLRNSQALHGTSSSSRSVRPSSDQTTSDQTTSDQRSSDQTSSDQPSSDQANPGQASSSGLNRFFGQSEFTDIDLNNQHDGVKETQIVLDSGHIVSASATSIRVEPAPKYEDSSDDESLCDSDDFEFEGTFTRYNLSMFDRRRTGQLRISNLVPTESPDMELGLSYNNSPDSANTEVNSQYTGLMEQNTKLQVALNSLQSDISEMRAEVAKWNMELEGLKKQLKPSLWKMSVMSLADANKKYTMSNHAMDQFKKGKK